MAFHCPMRRSVRGDVDWMEILAGIAWSGLKLEILAESSGGLIDSAIDINSAKVFLGTVSSCNAIAQGLGKPTLVEQFPGCFNTRPTVSLNGMTNQQVVDEVIRRCK